jgi:hypothetical protein
MGKLVIDSRRSGKGVSELTTGKLVRETLID